MNPKDKEQNKAISIKLGHLCVLSIFMFLFAWLITNNPIAKNGVAMNMYFIFIMPIMKKKIVGSSHCLGVLFMNGHSSIVGVAPMMGISSAIGCCENMFP